VTEAHRAPRCDGRPPPRRLNSAEHWRTVLAVVPGVEVEGRSRPAEVGRGRRGGSVAAGRQRGWTTVRWSLRGESRSARRSSPGASGGRRCRVRWRARTQVGPPRRCRLTGQPPLFHLRSGDAGGRSRLGGSGGAAALRAATSGRPGAGGAAILWLGAHHPEEGLHRRDDRGRHGPAVSAVPAGQQRASTSPAHPPLRGGAGPGEPVEGRASRRSRRKPPPRATSRVGRITRGAIARGRSFWHAPSRWTSSPARGARGG
jgi:hypothetical protein